MDGSLEQLMRLLANRGLEWLRQRIMDLPDPCPLDHPDVGALALAARVAPVLSGMLGRISPLEVIVLRRVTPDLLRAGAVRVLDGDRTTAMRDLVLAGGLVARADPLWQLACNVLAEDPVLPLAEHLALSEDPDLLTRAEALVTTLPAKWQITSGHVETVTDVVMQLYRHGACRPRLSHPRVFSAIFDHLVALARWSQAARCTVSVARTAYCLRLIDPDHDIKELMTGLIQFQRPDGSFPARAGYASEMQSFAEAVQPTLFVVMTLHMAAYRRWRGRPPVWLRPQPLHGAVDEIAARLAAAVTQEQVPPALLLHAATSLTRATGINWLSRLEPGLRQQQSGPPLAVLAGICFRDGPTARRLRTTLGLTRADKGECDDRARAEMDWLYGRPVSILGALPPALLHLWDRAARAGDRAQFLEGARLALHHQQPESTPAIRAMARRMAGEALFASDPHADPVRMLADLDRMLLLAQLFEPETRVAAAA